MLQLLGLVMVKEPLLVSDGREWQQLKMVNGSLMVSPQSLHRAMLAA